MLGSLRCIIEDQEWIDHDALDYDTLDQRIWNVLADNKKKNQNYNIKTMAKHLVEVLEEQERWKDLEDYDPEEITQRFEVVLEIWKFQNKMDKERIPLLYFMKMGKSILRVEDESDISIDENTGKEYGYHLLSLAFEPDNMDDFEGMDFAHIEIAIDVGKDEEAVPKILIWSDPYVDDITHRIILDNYLGNKK